VTSTAHLGGGYADRLPDPRPTAAAVLAAAQPGDPGAHLVVLCGPPGVGKSTVAAQLLRSIGTAVLVDKDLTAAGFILQAAAGRGLDSQAAYGSDEYHTVLRPLEYSGAMAQACANLVGDRLVLLCGGWGPELALEYLWTNLAAKVHPARFSVVHLEAPPLEQWRQRLGGRGSRSDSPWFEAFAAAVTALPVWSGAIRIASAPPAHRTAAAIAQALGRRPDAALTCSAAYASSLDKAPP
jgi:hypothetical protein